MRQKGDWHQSIYSKEDGGLDPEYWRRVRDFVIDRDHQRCQSCLRRKLKRQLSVHHIIPRKEGGGDDLENLISLCIPCHDEIEDTDIRTATEIRGYNAIERAQEKEPKESPSKEIAQMLERIDARRPSWHARVYGGVK